MNDTTARVTVVEGPHKVAGVQLLRKAYAKQVRLAKEERKAAKAVAADTRAAERKTVQENFKQLLIEERAKKLEYWRAREARMEEKRNHKKLSLRQQSSVWIAEENLEKRILELQCDQFEEFFAPEMGKYGYEALYKKRAQEMWIGDPRKIDGCAIFFLKHRFSRVRKYEIEFNKTVHSLIDSMSSKVQRVDGLGRLVKDNVALIVVLEENRNTDNPGERHSVCLLKKGVQLLCKAYTKQVRLAKEEQKAAKAVAADTRAAERKTV